MQFVNHMLIVLPVTGADHKLAVSLASWMSRLGGTKSHTLLLAFSRSCPEECREIVERRLSGAFKREHVFDIPSNDERGWPLSANTVFHDVAHHVCNGAGCYDEPCWYFFEADNTPVRPSWADELQMEWALAKMPCMGVIHATFMRVNGERKEKGRHMVGTGIYPKDFFRSCKLARHIPATRWPFDVFLQNELVPRAHATGLILHNWQSAKYRRSRGKSVVCEPARDGGYNAPFTEDRDGPAVVHGCKDGSLVRLLRKETKGA